MPTTLTRTPDNSIETNGYAECRGCGEPVINAILCAYCDEARQAHGMHEIPNLTRNELDTLCVLSEDPVEAGD